MLNAYTVEKKLRDHLRAQKALDKTRCWLNWEGTHRGAWINRYRDRISKFVVNVSLQSIPCE